MYIIQMDSRCNVMKTHNMNRKWQLLNKYHNKSLIKRNSSFKLTDLYIRAKTITLTQIL